ncbi:MAG: dCTP deaminase [Ancalomicrobiaceae bacterium]|nr:dCTP deaminase [Ancalomicrobiaceae bacterium]
MILTDREIGISLSSGLIDVTPEPDASAYSSTSLDLRLDQYLQIFKQRIDGVETTVDPGKPGYSFASALTALAEKREITADGYILPPQQLVLAWTKEKIGLKPTARLAGRVEGKSSLARLGLAVHITAPTIHAGFSGQIQLEIINFGPLPIRLRSGMNICQLIFETTLGVPEKGYQGQFAGQLAAR